MPSKKIGTIFNLSPLKNVTQIYFRNKCGARQRVYVAVPSNSTTHQSARTLRIHTLYLVMRNFPGKTLVPADRQNVRAREFSYGPERPVRGRQCVVGFAQLGRDPGKHMNAEGTIITATTAHFRSTTVDWHQACCRKRPWRASQAPSKRPIPMAISRTRTTLAPCGAAVSRNAAINSLSPRRLPTAFRSPFS